MWDLSTTQLDRETCDWLAQFGVVGPHNRRWLERIQCGKLAAYSFGYGGHARARLCADLISWLFLFDDAYAEGSLATQTGSLRRQHARYDALLAGDLSAAPANAFGRSLADLFQRLFAVAPRSWVLRLGASVRGYLDGCELETTFRARGVTPTLEAYLFFRDRSIGVYPMLDMIEFAQSAYVTADELRDPIVSALRHSGNLVIALTNDLYSSLKESSEAESFNAVLVHQRQHGVSREDAIRHVLALQTRLRNEFEHYAASLPVDASPGLLELPGGVRAWIEGNRQWSSETPRYNELTAVLEGYRPPPSVPTVARHLAPAPRPSITALS